MNVKIKNILGNPDCYEDLLVDSKSVKIILSEVERIEAEHQWQEERAKNNLMAYGQRITYIKQELYNLKVAYKFEVQKSLEGEKRIVELEAEIKEAKWFEEKSKTLIEYQNSQIIELLRYIRRLKSY